MASENRKTCKCVVKLLKYYIYKYIEDEYGPVEKLYSELYRNSEFTSRNSEFTSRNSEFISQF